MVVAADADAPDLSAPDEIIIGDPSSGDETITGTSGDDTLIGGGGDDTISGWQGDDLIYGDSPDGGDGEIDGDGNLVAPLDITASLTDLDGSETLSITISGVPTGAFLSAGINNADGSWTLTETELTDLTITVSPDNADFQLTVDATSTDTDPDTGLTDTATTTTTIDVDITGGGAAGSDTISGGQGDDTIYGGAGDDTISGDQGDDVIFGDSGADTISGGQGNDQLDGGSGVDTLSGGQGDDILDGGAGANIVDGGQGDDTASFTVGESDGGVDVYDGGQGVDTLVVNLSEEDLNNPEMVAEMLTLRAFIEENSDDTGSSGPSQTFATLGIMVSNFEDVQFLLDGEPVDLDASAPDLDVSDASGTEDLAIDLDITALLTDTDGSESLSIEIAGVPTGATLTNTAGDVFSGAASFTLTADQLDGLTITPPLNSDVDFQLTVSATATETLTGDTSTTTGTIAVSVAADADAPTLDLDSATPGDQAAGAAAGFEDQPIDLDITSALTDTDGSENLSITIEGVPAGATLNYGDYDAETGNWTLDSGDLSGLQITPADDSNDDFTLRVTATSTEADGGDSVSVVGNISVSVTGVADTPDVTVQDETGFEDQWTQLNLDADLTDTDGSETLSIEITGVPDGAILSPGTFVSDGVWTVSATQLPLVCIRPPNDFSGDITMTLAVTSIENDGDSTTVDEPFTVTVVGVADAPTLDLDSTSPGDQTAGAAAGIEDQPIDLDITSALTDVDGSESLSITIGGVPAGATLTNAAGDIFTGSTSFTLTAEQLDGLQITPAAGSDTDFQLTVAATSTEGDSSDQATVSGTIDVTVGADADAPTLDLDSTAPGDQTAGAAADVEDTAIALDISAALIDADGSESLSIEIANVPTGATLTNTAGDIFTGASSFTLTAR